MRTATLGPRHDEPTDLSAQGGYLPPRQRPRARPPLPPLPPASGLASLGGGVKRPNSDQPLLPPLPPLLDGALLAQAVGDPTLEGGGDERVAAAAIVPEKDLALVQPGRRLAAGIRLSEGGAVDVFPQPRSLPVHKRLAPLWRMSPRLTPPLPSRQTHSVEISMSSASSTSGGGGRPTLAWRRGGTADGAAGSSGKSSGSKR